MINQVTKAKLLEDPNAIENSILVNPEPLGEMSPTLQEDFPDDWIPTEKCKIEMTELIECMLKNRFDNVRCENFQLIYYNCKKFRDSNLFALVKKWDCHRMKEIKEEERNEYIRELLSKKAKLLKDYETTEINIDTKGYRRRIDNDISQLNWRINYLPQCVNEISEIKEINQNLI